MTLELNKEYRIVKSKRILFQGSAFVLFFGALVSIPTSFILRSVLPLLGGIFLVIQGYWLYTLASHSLYINSDGIHFKHRHGESLLNWSEIGEITLGKGIYKHKVAYTLIDKPPSPKINFGLFHIDLHEGYHLPDTFGIKAKELAAALEQTRKEQIQHRA